MHLNSTLCLDIIELIIDKYKLKGDYNEINDRISISFEISKCYNDNETDR